MGPQGGLFINIYFGKAIDKRMGWSKGERLLYWSIDWQLANLVSVVLFFIVESRKRINNLFP